MLCKVKSQFVVTDMLAAGGGVGVCIDEPRRGSGQQVDGASGKARGSSAVASRDGLRMRVWHRARDSALARTSLLTSRVRRAHRYTCDLDSLGHA